MQPACTHMQCPTLSHTHPHVHTHIHMHTHIPTPPAVPYPHPHVHTCMYTLQCPVLSQLMPLMA